MGDTSIDDRYPIERLDPDSDDGTMPASVSELAAGVVGHRIVSAEKASDSTGWRTSRALVITLDNGRQVRLADMDDCCAYTELDDFFLHPESVDHMILGVGTTGEYTTWHIYADFGDVMKLDVGWSCGNPFYYGYGFAITVTDIE